MALTPGSRLGPYAVTALLGEGGMGQVYRATDTNLKRQVAIKVLPASLGGDADRLARFQREAEVLAALNHPNIAAIYGLERTPDFTALVMELVEGDDLSHHIAKGAIPLDDALPIAKQIAEALEAAHEQGIIHRDLKPANIKVRADGTVKVLDFGLAKALDPPAAASPEAMNSPTITTPAMTQAGMILGTAAYMSPEQARGKTVDKRADIWAFGVVLFEMLTGTRAFPGEDLTDTLAAVVRAEPNWTQLPPGLSSSLVTYIKRCLHKDPKQRIPDIAAMRLALDGAFDTAASSSVAAAPLPARGTPVAWVAALAVAVAVIIALAIPAVRYLRETPPASPPEMRTEVSTPVTSRPTDFALSPDGRQIVFVASSDGASRLWLRSLATTSAQPLTGTEGAFYPFWSPDSRSIGFFAGTALKRLDLGGGAPQTLASASRGRGGMWTADGFIVFSPSSGPLRRVSATGGQATSVTTLGPKIASHRFPVALPDGRRFLFYAQGEENAGGIFVGALDGSAPTRLVAAESAGMFLPSSLGPAEASREGGWLLWVRAGALVAQQLDVTKAVLAGEPVTLADAVAVESGGSNRSAISVAPTGLVAYRVGGSGRSQLTWVDRLGAMRGSVGEEDPAGISQPRLSPDGRRVAVSRTIQANADVWLIDGARTSRITFDAANDQWPVWSPDGTRIAFESNRETGDADLYQKLASGAGAEERLVTSKQLKAPSSWSSDGRFLLYRSVDLETNSDLWVVPMVGKHTPSVFLKTPFNELRGVFSPDGRWVAYQSNESGRDEIYVRPFVPPGSAGSTAAGSQWQVSTAGGFMPAWRHDGKELYYLNASGSMMAAPIAVAGATLEPGAPVVLFPTRILVGGADTGPAWHTTWPPTGAS